MVSTTLDEEGVRIMEEAFRKKIQEIEWGTSRRLGTAEKRSLPEMRQQDSVLATASPTPLCYPKSEIQAYLRRVCKTLLSSFVIPFFGLCLICGYTTTTRP